MIALGLALQDRGHGVVFATSPPFREPIEAAGLEFHQIPPAWTHDELTHWMGRLHDIATPLFQLRELYRAARPHLPAIVDAMDDALCDADVLISSYLFPMNRVIAEKHGVPFATFAFAHNTVPSRYYPPDGFPHLRKFPRWIQHTWNRWLWRLGNVTVDTVINQTIARPLRARGLPLVKDFFSKPADLVLVAVSPSLMKPPFPVNGRFRFTGYCRWQEKPNENLEAEILRFTRGEKVPVLTFGSMVYEEPERWMERLASAWPANKKMIIQSGWAGFETPADCSHFKTLGPMSHNQLFRHASMVIHHGGAGTTASVLHAGKPHVIVPHIGDQNFFAQEIIRLGCGQKIAKRSWPEKLSRVVSRVQDDDGFRNASGRAAALLKTENGPAVAASAIEGFVSRSRGLPQSKRRLQREYEPASSRTDRIL